MKIKDHLSIRKIGDNYMIVTESDAGLDFTRIISLNESAYYLVQQVKGNDFSAGDWVNLLTTKYNVTETQARNDVENLLETLKKSGVIAPE